MVSEGSHIIEIDGGFHVWTRKIGDSPIKVLLVHGGPGMSHEYFEPFEDVLPPKGMEIYFYDQLGSYFSDQPDDPDLWTIDRFCKEIETVRIKLGLDQFYLLGQSWGGILGLEYGFRYGKALKGLIISNMVDNMDDYASYIGTLREQLPEEDVKKMKAYEAKEEFGASEYQALCLKLYEKCICRKVPWPDAVNRTFQHLNEQVYTTLQGPNEFTITGSLGNWNVRQQLPTLTMPTLLMGAKYDSMNPKVIKKMGELVPHSRVFICPNGSHFSMWDDPNHYFPEIIKFINDIEQGKTI
ncbi:MAG: proline iminopeptidase-family hydrolase [Sporolactobacillus sp.]|jgi:proline iminopeptidase|nr:proline iminopeptidase-family hydrolase [Sporolactobacillus sp.]